MSKTAPVAADLNPAPYNPRKITKDALANLRKSLAEFGDLSGVVFNRRTKRLVGGHQRLKVLDPKAPITKTERKDKQGTVAAGHIETIYGRLTYREVDWPETKEKAANISANQNRGRWDEPMLAGLFENLRIDGIDVGLTGFTTDEIDNLLAETTDARAGEDDIPPRGGKGATRAKPGDLWALGDHRLLVGDATRAADVSRLMAGEQAAMVFTDPPYGVSYQDHNGQFEVIEGDDHRGDQLLRLLAPALKQAVLNSRADAGFYVWHASSTREEFAAAIRAAGLVERQYIIWAKPNFSVGHTDYRWAHEPCFYASRAEHKPAFHGGRAEPTVWRVAAHPKSAAAVVVGTGVLVQDGNGSALFIQGKAPNGRRTRALRLEAGRPVIIESGAGDKTTVWEVGRDRDYQHPTQKPVELARRAIENSSRKGEIVLDLFLGSGTTIIGAEATGRHCYGTEIDPVYADVILARWEGITQRQAVRTDGK